MKSPCSLLRRHLNSKLMAKSKEGNVSQIWANEIVRVQNKEIRKQQDYFSNEIMF